MVLNIVKMVTFVLYILPFFFLRRNLILILNHSTNAPFPNLRQLVIYFLFIDL